MSDAVLARRSDQQGPIVTGDQPDQVGDRLDREVAAVAELVTGPAWDAVSAEFCDLVPEQTAAFCQSHWGERNVESLLFRTNGTVIGGACAVVRAIPFTKTGIAVVKWGPAWRRTGEKPSSQRLRTVLSSLREEYCHRRNFHLTVMPPAHPLSADLSDQALDEIGFRKGEMLAAPKRYFVNVGMRAQDLLASVDQKWRYNLKKARRNEFRIEFAAGAEGLEAFLALYRQMLDRKRFADHSAIASLPQLIGRHSAAVRPKIALVYHDGRPTAGGVFWIGDETATYMFGATDDRALGLKAGYALHWWFAEHLCQLDGVAWYDLGGDDLDAGLHQFKKGFVGKRGEIVMSPPSRRYASSALAELVGTSAFAVRNARRMWIRAMHRLKPAATG